MPIFNPLLFTTSTLPTPEVAAVSVLGGGVAAPPHVSCIEKPEDVEVQEEAKKKKNNEG